MANQRAITLPFSINENYGIGFTSNENKIWRDRVFLALMTGLRERVMRPDYGSQIKQVLFENEQTADAVIQTTVRAAFTTWLPSLSLLDVITELDVETMQFIITIKYRLPNATTDEITIDTGTFTRSGDIVEGNA